MIDKKGFFVESTDMFDPKLYMMNGHGMAFLCEEVINIHIYIILCLFIKMIQAFVSLVFFNRITKMIVTFTENQNFKK